MMFFFPIHPSLLDTNETENISKVYPLVQYANVGVSLLSIAMITINR
jgi:hypothetical protein